MNIRFSFFIMIVIILLTAGCVSQQSTAPALTPVKFGYQATTSNAPVYIAKEEGFFAEQGIDLQLVKVQSTASSIPLLLHGDIDATGGPVGIATINAVLDGGRIRIVADKGSLRQGGCGALSFMVQKDLYDKGLVRNVSDLKGRKVFSASGKDYELSHALANGNLTYDDVDVVVMDYASALIAFKNGAIAAGALPEPFITQGLKNGSVAVLMPAQDYIPGYGVPIYYGPNLLDKNPELGRRFMVAYLKGVRQFNEGKTPRNLAIIANYTQQDEALLNQTCWWTVAADGYYPTQPVRDYLDWAVANKKIPRDMDEKLLYDMSYTQYANGILQNETAGTR